MTKGHYNRNQPNMHEHGCTHLKCTEMYDFHKPNEMGNKQTAERHQHAHTDRIQQVYMQLNEW